MGHMDGCPNSRENKTYEIVAGGEAIKCLRCGMTSWHPKDVEHLYCGNCHEFHVRFSPQRGIVIWLDDMRDPHLYSKRTYIEDRLGFPAERVYWAKNYDEFVKFFKEIHQDPERKVLAVFFDNDLGHGKQGRHAFTWMERYVRENGIGPFELYAQTSKPAARRELYGGFKSLKRHWEST